MRFRHCEGKERIRRAMYGGLAVYQTSWWLREQLISSSHTLRIFPDDPVDTREGNGGQDLAKR